MIKNKLKSYCHIPHFIIQDKEKTPEFRFGCCLLLSYYEFDIKDIYNIFAEYNVNTDLASQCLDYLVNSGLMEDVGMVYYG